MALSILQLHTSTTLRVLLPTTVLITHPVELSISATPLSQRAPSVLAWIPIFQPHLSLQVATHTVPLHVSIQKLPTEHKQLVQPCPGGWSHVPTRLRRHTPPCPWKPGSFHGKFPLCRMVLRAAGFPSACLEGFTPSCSSKTWLLFCKAMPGKKTQPFPSLPFFFFFLILMRMGILFQKKKKPRPFSHVKKGFPFSGKVYMEGLKQNR